MKLLKITIFILLAIFCCSIAVNSLLTGLLNFIRNPESWGAIQCSVGILGIKSSLSIFNLAYKCK